jgi:hypothetical protein
VYTSYDYSAPLRETRQIQDKFKQTKLLGLFSRVSKDLLESHLAGSGAGYSVNTQSIWTFHLQNQETGAGFYTVQQTDSRSRSVQKFSITLSISLGSVTVPEIELDGRQSKIIVTDYSLGNVTSLLYSSAEVLTYGIFDKPVLILYLKAGQTGEIAFSGAKRDFVTHGHTVTIKHSDGITDFRGRDQRFSRYSWAQGKGVSVVSFGNNATKDGLLVYMLDIPSAWSFFAPPTTKNPNIEPDQQIFVLGPYLVRSANVTNNILYVYGDSEKATDIEAYTGSPRVQTINWNGKDLKTEKTAYGALTAKIPGPEGRVITLPILDKWKVADSFPEQAREYDDSKWTVCDRMVSRSPTPPLTFPSLHSSDYGFYTGIKIYRGHFDGKAATKANITVSGGAAAGWNAWLNGKLVGGANGDPKVSANWAMLDFSNTMLLEKGNVLTVLTDYHGHDQTSVGPSGGENPRGILGATLFASNKSLNFTQWKIQGNAGGGASKLDDMRGPMNEGGLYGERLGWHLPGFDNSDWKKANPVDGLSKSGVNWYTTTFKLDIDGDLDVPIGIELGAPRETVARVQLFVNG